MNVLIVDDELPARQRLRSLVAEHDDCTVVGEAGNGVEAIEKVQALQPDVVLLDIRMPGMDGIEAARHLELLDDAPAVIFTTAFDEYAIQAFDARAIGYVLKPVRRERLQKALSQAARLTRGSLRDIGNEDDQPRSHVSARVRNELRLIALDDIVCFHADQKYVRVCHAQGNDLIDDSLKSLEQEFGDAFVRIHRSVLVSIAQIEALEKQPDGQTCIRLRLDVADVPLTISRRHLANVRRRLKGS